ELSGHPRQTRSDGHDRIADGELARFLGVRALGVAEIVQLIDELGSGQRLSPPELEGTGEDPRQHMLSRAVQTRVNHTGARKMGVSYERGGCRTRTRSRAH